MDKGIVQENSVIAIGIDLGYKAWTQGFVFKEYFVMPPKIQVKYQMFPFGRLSSHGSKISHAMVYMCALFSGIDVFLFQLLRECISIKRACKTM